MADVEQEPYGLCGAGAGPVVNGPQPILEHRIGPDDTDHLGHMNIRRYAELAEAGVPLVLARLGVEADELDASGHVAVVVDAYTRHYREQYADATLTLVAGILGADHQGITMYAELRNLALAQLAATFVHVVRLFRAQDRAPIDVPDHAVDAARPMVVEWPEHGRPRTVRLDPIRLASPQQLRELPLEVWNDGRVGPDSCDRHGWYAGGPTTLAWGVERELSSTLDDAEHSWLFTGPDGQELALTNVENRRVLVQAPHAGARVRTVAANIAIGSNRRVRREWSFDPDSSDVYAAGDFVDLLFDPASRRTVEMPATVRRELERRYHPDLG